MNYVNILTIHNDPNYGALLQAYALYHVVEGLGYTPRMIDLHILYRSHDYNLLNRILIKLNNYIKGYNYCYDIAHKFCKENEPNQVGPFFSVKQLCQYNKWSPSDMYIIGSDQVWNTEITHKLIKAYTFEFLPKECKFRYAYASSFGNIKDEQDRAKQLDVLGNLSKFRKIGVRESFGKEYLQKYDIDSIVVLDPTLLIEDYSHLLHDKPIPNNNLLYLPLGAAPEMEAFVHQVSSKFKMPIEVKFGYLQPSRKLNKKWLKVGQWLNHISSSKLIITDSFHATVFAIQFERPFYVYISNPSKAFRIANILGLLGLQDRIVSNIDQVDLDKVIDYAIVKQKLRNLRKDSLAFLNEILRDYESSLS